MVPGPRLLCDFFHLSMGGQDVTSMIRLLQTVASALRVDSCRCLPSLKVFRIGHHMRSLVGELQGVTDSQESLGSTVARLE